MKLALGGELVKRAGALAGMARQTRSPFGAFPAAR